MGSAYRSYIAIGTPAGLRFSSIALDIAKIPDAKCCSNISLFFYDLADEFSIGHHRHSGLYDDYDDDVNDDDVTTTTTTTSGSGSNSSTNTSLPKRQPSPPRELNYEAYKELYTALARVLVGHLVLPADYEALREDDQDDIKDFRRYAVGQTLRSCACVLGDEVLLGLVLEMYDSALRAYDGREWRGLEAAVYGLRAIARCVPIDSEHSAESPIKAFFETLPRLPAAPLLQYTAILVVGRYADWLRYTPAARTPLLTYTTRALQAPGPAAPAAALAFLHICEACSSELVCYAEDIFVLLKSVLRVDALATATPADIIALFGKNKNNNNNNNNNNNSVSSSSSSSSSSSPSLDDSNIEDVINGAADVFGYLPTQDIARILGALVNPHAAAVNTLLSALKVTTDPRTSGTSLATTAATATTSSTSTMPGTSSGIIGQTTQQRREVAGALAALFRRMGTLFKHIYPEQDVGAGEEHPTITVFRGVLPTVEALYSCGLGVEDVVAEQACRCLRGVVTAANDRVVPLLRPVLEMVLNVLSAVPCPCELYLLNVVVECTHECPQARPLLTEAFCHASNTIFQLSRSRDAIATNPQLVAEYFELAILCMTKIDIAKTPFVEKILHLALGSLQALQTCGIKAVLKFLAELLHLAKSQVHADLRAIIARVLPHIVHVLLVCAAETQDKKVLALVVRITRSFIALDKLAFMLNVAACLRLSCSDGSISAVPHNSPLPPCGAFPYPADFRARAELYNSFEVSTRSSQIAAALEQFQLVCKSS